MSNKTLRETVGFIGVVASLVFVGWEIRQNTTAVRASAIQGMTELAVEQIHLMINDPEVNRISMIGYDDLESLTQEERQRLYWVGRSGWLGVQGMFRQWKLGVLPDEEWETMRRLICDDISAAGVRVMWQEHAELLVPSFVDEVESCEGFRVP